MKIERVRFRVCEISGARVTLEGEKDFLTVPLGIIPSSIRENLHKESIIYADVKNGEKGPLVSNFSED